MAYVPLAGCWKLTLDEETVNELRSPPAMPCGQTIASEEKVESVSEELKTLEGIDSDLVRQLAEHAITTRDDLADLAVDDLVEMTGMEADAATALITKAREHWFSEE